MSKEPTSRTLPCFKCGKELEPVCPSGDGRNQPYSAVVFETRGQYGSTVFDEIDGATLHINICDECLVSGKSVVLHKEGFPKRELKPWVPDHAAAQPS